MKTSLFVPLRIEILLLLTLSASAYTLKKTGGRRLQQTEGSGLYEGVYQDTTTQLRSSILEGNLELATSLLTVSKDVDALGAGLRFPPGDPDQFRIMTPERTSDPDVITIKAVAGASLRLGDCNWVSSSSDDPYATHPQVLGILKLANVLIIAITPEGGVFPEGVNQFMLQVDIIHMLADRTFMQQVLDDDPLASALNRRLLVESGVPANSWVCAFCYPKRFCSRSSWWCAS